jgi:hypothetical protein
MYIWIHRDMDMEIRHGHGDNHMGNVKQKPRQFSLIQIPFLILVNGSLLFVPLLTKKQKENIRLKPE